MDNDTKSPTRMSKLELVSALTDLGYTTKDLLDTNGKPMKRAELLIKLQNHQSESQDFGILADVEEDDEDGVVVDQESDDSSTEMVIPGPHDPGWTQYVLGKFMEDEVDGKNPRVEGLRRVAGELVGELIEEGCDLVASPSEDNRFRACVKAWGVFMTSSGISKRFEALADAHGDNCLEDFSTYLVAMADTRAKGRMFRNALGLKRVVAAEEVSKTVAMAEDIQKGGAIHTGQISMIRLMADRQEINVSQILDKLGIVCEPNERTGDVDLRTLSYEDALATVTEIRLMKEEKENK